MKVWSTKKHQQDLKYKKDKKKWDKQRSKYLQSVRESLNCPTASRFFDTQETKRNENDTSVKGQ